MIYFATLYTCREDFIFASGKMQREEKYYRDETSNYVYRVDGYLEYYSATDENWFKSNARIDVLMNRQYVECFQVSGRIVMINWKQLVKKYTEALMADKMIAFIKNENDAIVFEIVKTGSKAKAGRFMPVDFVLSRGVLQQRLIDFFKTPVEVK